MRRFFEDFLKNHPASGKQRPLPLTHGAKAVLLRDMLQSRMIELPKKECETLGGKYVFTFYGRPCYRPHVDPDGLRKTTGAPTYLILKPNVLQQAARAHALDTGAFAKGSYSSEIDSALAATDFGFEATPENLAKMVSLYFGTNDSYLNNAPRPGVNLPDGQDEAQALHDIIHSGASGGDDRDTAIEIVFDQPIKIDASSIQCAVLPDVLENAENYGDLLSALGIDAVTYKFRRGLKSGAYHSELSNALYDYYLRNGLV